MVTVGSATSTAVSINYTCTVPVENFTLMNAPKNCILINAPKNFTLTKASESHVAVPENVTPVPAHVGQKREPGFEGIFAITGLVAVAYLILGKKK